MTKYSSNKNETLQNTLRDCKNMILEIHVNCMIFIIIKT